jgi:Gamma-glutamyl cyclotransferase, AIG2-like
MSDRRADVFFYGLFMDQDLLREKNISPTNVERASVEGLELRIGKRAALVESAGSRVHGVVMSLTLPDLERLYSDPGVAAYKPQAVLAELANGDTVAALCYNLPHPPAPAERDAEYAAKLRVIGRKVGLPAEYLASLG